MPKPKTLDLRRQVAERLKQTGTSQRRLAELSDIGQNKISEWLSGKHDLYGDRLARVLNALGPPRLTWPKLMHPPEATAGDISDEARQDTP